jgi:hypothetical protein
MQRHFFAFSDDEGLNDGDGEGNGDGDGANDYAYNILNQYSYGGGSGKDGTDSCLFDMEHYFKYRLNRASHNKDYASAVYQQYSGSGRGQNSQNAEDAAVNTDESYVRQARAEEEARALVKNFVSTSTSTDALNFIIEAFSKHQVLSPNTLTKEKSKLVDASTSTEG